MIFFPSTAARARPRFVLASCASTSSPGPMPMRANCCKHVGLARGRRDLDHRPVDRLPVRERVGLRVEGLPDDRILGRLTSALPHCDSGVSLYWS